MSFPNVIFSDGNAAPIFTADTEQKNALGRRMVLEDGRVFAYAKAGGTLNPDLGVKNADTQHVAFTTIAADADKYAMSIVIDVGSGDGTSEDGVIGKDELIGGYLVVFDNSSKAFTRRITSNTVTTGAGEMTVGLDIKIPVALVTDTDHAECMASPYRNVKANVDNTSSVVGIPTVVATSGQWLWLQTWGPVWIAPQGAVSTGSNDRQVIFRHDGSIDQHDYNDAMTKFGQHAGFVLANAPGGSQGAAFIMLQISV